MVDSNAPTEPLHCIELTINNYKGIRAVRIDPNGAPLVYLGGKNAQGKTSVIDAVWAALGGGDASRATPVPVRKGEDHASVRLDLGALIVTRSWSALTNSSKLVVTNANGTEFKSPQSVLDALLGDYAFDPLAFSKMTEREQVKVLVAALRDKLSFDPDELEERRSTAFSLRAAGKKDAAELKAQLKGYPTIPDGTPDEPYDVAGMYEELRAADRHNQDIERRADKLNGLHVQVEALRQRKADAEAALEQVTAQLSEASTEALALHKEVSQMEVRDTSDLQAAIADVDSLNHVVGVKRERAKLQEKLDLALEKVATHDATLVEVAKIKAEGIAAADIGVEGLSFDDDGVTLNGVPLKQLSGRERLVVCISLAMAMNPTIRILRIDGGEALDTDGVKLVAEMAAENDFQVFIARVDETGTIGWTIEDGEVAA